MKNYENHHVHSWAPCREGWTWYIWKIIVFLSDAWVIVHKAPDIDNRIADIIKHVRLHHVMGFKYAYEVIECPGMLLAVNLNCRKTTYSALFLYDEVHTLTAVQIYRFREDIGYLKYFISLFSFVHHASSRDSSLHSRIQDPAACRPWPQWRACLILRELLVGNCVSHGSSEWH